jgi:protein TonB
MWAANNRLLTIAIAASLLVHAVLLSLHFAPPVNLSFKPLESGLEIILVNARHDKAPLKAEALAQANLDGGGNAEAGRAHSPLPPSAQIVDGSALAAQRRIAELEQQQSRVLAQMAQPDPHSVPQLTEKNTPAQASNKPAPAPQEQAIALARREAEIARRIEDYNKRPVKTQITPSTREVAYAMYYTAMQKRIEQIGTLNFPQQDGKKLYGELVIAIPVFQDGSLYFKDGGPRIERSSGIAALDAAALAIVRRAAPFGRFTAGLPADGKSHVWEVITRFAFTRDNALLTGSGERN